MAGIALLARELGFEVTGSDANVYPPMSTQLEAAGIEIGAVDAIKTHNPFAVNDAYFAREMGVPVESFNDYGSSLIFGHPQGPTGTRLVIDILGERRPATVLEGPPLNPDDQPLSI